MKDGSCCLGNQQMCSNSFEDEHYMDTRFYNSFAGFQHLVLIIIYYLISFVTLNYHSMIFYIFQEFLPLYHSKYNPFLSFQI